MWNYSAIQEDNLSPATSSSNATAIIVLSNRTFSIVIIVTNNTALTAEKINQKFKDTLLRISYAVAQKSLTTDPLLDSNRTDSASENEAAVMFHQATRLYLCPGDKPERVTEDLRRAWEDALSKRHFHFR